ncbi:MAG TPA: pyruvate kinase alpha/beta domain-containing protein, partial [Plasticicumulans sp.]|nr:pyruvate kinase alpha/beta domain-containing protein [Plasticicumulans sp.]
RAAAIGAAVSAVAGRLQAAAVVAYTSSGCSALRVARERPPAAVIGMTPHAATARRLTLVWGVHAVLCADVTDVSGMSELACTTVRREGYGRPGQPVVIAAGMPFGTAGSTNLLHIAELV